MTIVRVCKIGEKALVSVITDNSIKVGISNYSTILQFLSSYFILSVTKYSSFTEYIIDDQEDVNLPVKPILKKK